MKRGMKKILKACYIAINRLFFSLFFDRRYLRGKYFDIQLIGWSWARRALFRQKFLGVNRRSAGPWEEISTSQARASISMPMI